jgi:hypothetical protein
MAAEIERLALPVQPSPRKTRFTFGNEADWIYGRVAP